MFMPKKAATSWLSVLVLLFSFVVPILGTAPAANAATLAMEFDPGSSASYPGSGTTLTDQISGATGTMSNVTYSGSTNCGVLNFNGSNSYVSFGQKDFGNNFSFSTWYKANSLTSNIKTFMSNAGANPQTNGFKLFYNGWLSNDNNLYIESGNSSTGGSISSSGGGAVETTNWHHYVFTIDKANALGKIYKDKTLVASATITSGIGMNNTWWLGAIGGNSYWLNGDMGVTKIYSTLLNSSEITADYDSNSARYTATPTCPTRTLTAPTSVSVSAATQSLNVSWSAPAETNGAVISGYQVEYSTSGTGSWTTASSSIANNATSYTITGLTGGTQYYVRVAAKYGSNLGAYGYPWTKIYSVTNAARSSGLIQYETGFGLGAGNASNTYANSSFTRIRYKMAATYSSNNYYVDADFSKTLGTTSSYSETFDSMEKLQVPTISGSGSQFEIQGNVSDLNVQSNNPNVVDGSGLNGRLEIWPWNYDVSAQAGLSGRAGTTYDDSDTATLNATYGSFQLHTLSGTAATIFAWNNHSATPEIGFGNYSGTHSDWTFCSTDGGPGCANRTNFSLIIYVNIPIAALSARSVTYALNSGSGTAPTQADVAQGSTFTVASGSGISRTGYSFAGWSDGSTVYQPSATYTVGGSNVTLTAQWTSNDPTTTTFNYTGSAQTWTVPSGISSIRVSLTGGSGGVSNGGYGAVVTGTLAVTAGDVLQINVGGRGASGTVSNAFGGGGSAGSTHASIGGGGGASDIRSGAYGLDNRLIVAGGGGGGGGAGAGGNGGTPNGAAGTRDAGTLNGYPGGGGTSSAGGAAGLNVPDCWYSAVVLAQAGSKGLGGTGAGGGSSPYTMGAGGGGGYYGGGGGGAGCNYGAGGGGSSWVNSSLVTSATYSVAASRSDGTISITYGGYAPALTGATISGTATQGQTLTAAKQGESGGTAASTTYQWKSSSDNSTFTDIAGATNSTYVLTSSEVGKYIKVTISVSNTIGSNSATSSATTAVAAIAPTIGSATISGTKMSGQTLTATAGSLGGGAVSSTTYQWKSSSDNSTYTDISGATSSTYQLTASEIGKYIKVVITVTNTAGSNSATSSATTTIASPTSTPGTVLYTTDYNSGLKKRALDGTGSQSALGSVTTGVELAASGSYIYIGYHQIRRIGTDGTGLTTLRTISDQYGLAINNGYIYYGYEYGQKIGRMDIDGSNANDSFMDFSAVSGVPYTALMTIVGSTIYFGGGGNVYGSKIWKVDVSGGTPTACITDNQGIAGITSDGTYIYWTNYRTGTIGRAALNCSGVNASYITGVSYAWGITYADGYLYFNHYTSGGYTAKVAADLHYTNKTWVSNSSTQGIAIADGGAPVSLSAPTNSSLPTISGTAAYANTLTAGNGSWTSSPTSYTYQWSRASSSGGSYSNIAGATSSTYSLASADIGNYLKVTVTATNAAGSASATSTASSQVVKATPTFSSWSNVTKYLGDNTYTVSAPTVTGSISGTFTYSSSNTSVVSISGTTFTVAGVGTTTITATFTPSDSSLYNTATTTNTVSVLLPALTTPASAPTVALTVGSTSSSITVTFTSVTNAVSHTVRVYLSNGTTLVGTARTNFTSGSTITGLSANTTYKVTYLGVGDAVSNSDSAESAQASITTAIAPPTIGSATFSGTTTVGQTLTASATSVVGTVSSTTYQWKSSGTSGGAYSDISGATSNTYVLTSSEANKYIKVTITVANASGSNSATSNASAGAVVSIVATPTVSSVSPSAGTTAGGTTVTISGTNLSTVTDVTLGGTAATISSKTSTQLVIVTPAKSAGAVDLIITNTAGSLTKSSGYTYATTPTVRSWTTTPSITSGSVNDTFTVTYTAVCTTPQRYGPSMYDLIYYNNGSWAYNSYMGSGTSNDGGYTWTITKTYTLTANGTWKIDAYERGACWDSYNFTYAPRNYINVGVSGPTITSLSTTSGPTAGGTATTITGTNLTGVTGITVGGVSATSIRSNTATSVTFNTPAGTAGAKNVVVTTTAGSATSTGGFTYTAPITVTYDVNSADSGTPSRSTDSYAPNSGGFSLPTVGTMVKTGYSFGGWATANNSSTPITSPYNPQSTLTVYAIWTVKSYSTTYNVNGATSGSAPSVSNNNFGATVTVAGNSGSLARTGYTLAGWNTQADGQGTAYNLGSGTYTQTAANLILYADWIADTYSVSYDVNGSSDTAPTTHTGIVANGSVTLAAGITKAGFAFVGWEENSITYKAGATFRVGTADKTVVAKWIAVYTLSYNLNGSGATGSIPADHLYANGDPVTVDSVVPTRTGYTFSGWIDQSGTSHASNSTYNISSTNYLLYAVWTPISYTVTYALNGGSGTAPTESSKNYLASFTVAAAPSRVGYTFNGWSDGSVVYGAGSTYAMPAADKTLTAQWSANTYLITYDLAQGTSTVPSAVSKAFAATWALPDTPTRVGYNFLDWYDGTSGYAAQASYSMSTASNLTITARWSAIVFYTVTYDLDGGLGTAPTQDPLQNGQSFTLPADPAKTGFSFTGWSYASNTYTSGSTISMPASNVVVTATWTATSAGTYAITYIGNGSQTAVPTVPALASGATFTIDDGSGLIKNGYIFSGWSYGGNTYTGGETVTMPSGSVTLSAIWVPSVRATSVSHSVDSTSVTRGRSLTVTYSLGCYNSSSAPTIVENVSTTGESFINDISAQLTVVDAGYNWTVTRVYTLSYVGTYTVFATASGGCFSAATDSASSTVTVTEAPSNSGGSSNSNANSSGGSGSGAPASIPPVTVVGARMALVANKYYTLPKIASNATVSVEAKAGATNSVTSTIKEGTSTVTATTMLNVNSVTKGLSEVKIVENQLAVVPSQGFSGNATISVTVTDGATTSTVQIPVTVLPEPVKDPSITPVSARSTVVTWDASPNATNYQVFVDGKSACKTVGESCTINKILGPNANVDVVANGGDATKSEVVDADYQAKSNVTIAKISGTFGKSTLSKNDITNLNKVIATVEKQGFENIQITGITTTKLTATAAKARLDAMVEYIKSKVDNPDLVVKVVAPTTRTFTNQIAVK